MEKGGPFLVGGAEGQGEGQGMSVSDGAGRTEEMREIDLRTAGAGVRRGVLRLNAAVEEKTSVLDAAGLDRLLAASAFAPAIVDEAGQVLAFLIGFAPGADYARVTSVKLV